MRNERTKSPDNEEKAVSRPPEIDYAPKKLTLHEQILFGTKMAAVGSIIFIVLWLLDKVAAG